MSESLIYLASPYSDPDPAIREARFRAVCLHAARMVAAGELVYCPIAHSHPLSVSGGIDGSWWAWQRLDTEMLLRCDALIVLRLPGWRESKGIAAEVEAAKRLGLTLGVRDPAADEAALIHDVVQARLVGAPLPDEIRLRAAVLRAAGNRMPDREPKPDRKPRKRSCPVCGATFTPRHEAHRFCSAVCQYTAARMRRKGAK